MLNVDISNIWGSLSLGDMLENESEVFAAHGRLDEAGKAGQAAWLDAPELPDAQAEMILELAAGIREHSSALAVIGSDGSVSCARAAVELLLGTNYNFRPGHAKLFFSEASCSPRELTDLLTVLDGQEYTAVLLSQTGDDPETLLTARSIRWQLERRYGSDKAADHLVIGTDPAGGLLHDMAQEEKWQFLAFRPGSAPVFGMLSPAVLLILAVAGIDIREVLRGARETAQTLAIRSYENPAWLYAVSRFLLKKDGRRTEFLVCGEPAAEALGRWWEVLCAQDGMHTAYAGFPAGICGRSCQLFSEQQPAFETLLRFEQPEADAAVESDWKNLDGLGGLDGQLFAVLQDRMLQSALSCQTDIGVPAVTIDGARADAYGLGELAVFFMVSAALGGELNGVPAADGAGASLLRDSMRASLVGRNGNQ